MTDHADQYHGDEQAMVAGSELLLADLVENDDWLPDQYAIEGDTYRQYLLHCDPQQRFSVVSFVWGPGQTTPVHDHTVWGLVGMLRRARRASVSSTVDGSFAPVRTSGWSRGISISCRRRSRGYSQGVERP